MEWQDEGIILGARKHGETSAILEVMTQAVPAKKAEAAPKGALEVAGKMVTSPSDPVVDAYRRKLSMALF